MLIANDILWRASLVLLEPCVNTAFSDNIAAGTRTVTPSSMASIYTGAQLIIARGLAGEEVIIVTGTTKTTFTAVFANAHVGASVMGATFPSGQMDGTQPLFTQSEMLGYLAQAQNDFLLRLRPLYARAAQTLASATSVFAQPGDCIRLERLSIDGGSIPDSSQAYIDLAAPSWPAQVAKASPDNWFQDEVDTGNFGIRPQLSAPAAAALYYSQKAAASLALNDPLITPDIFSQYLKSAVLYRAFSKDGEQRDPERGGFFYRHFMNGIEISNRFLEGVKVQVEA